MKAILSFCLIFFFLVSIPEAAAGELSQKLANFPQWEKITSARSPEGDLIYPDWMA